MMFKSNVNIDISNI